MKNFFTLFSLAGLLLCTLNLKAQIDSTLIIGPTNVCSGDCATYTFFINNGTASIAPVWNYNGIVQTGNPALICFDQPGFFFLEVYDEEFGIETNIPIEVLGSFFTEIESNAPNCPDSNSNCETVCTGATVTYSLSNAEPGNTAWNITGSNDFSINGNEVTVTWNEAGTGSVSAFSENTGTGNALNINCGEMYPAPDFGIGTGYVYIEGNHETYDIQITTPDGGQFTTSGTNGLNQIDQLYPSLYSIVVTAPDGQQQECSMAIGADIGGGCALAAFPEYIQSPDCGLCNGEIFIIPTGDTQELNYTWSNGATGSYQSGLCPGTYSLTISDATNCQTIEEFTLAELNCPPSSCTTEAFLCVDILEAPEAAFTTSPSHNNNTIEICEGQTLFFQNQSTGAESFIWNFGDLNTSTSTNPEHTYSQSGIYTVELIAQNECFCSDTTSITVAVIDAEIPQIGCIGTICAGETVTYTADASCSIFNWEISGNGAILSGGSTNDDFITVEWGDGPTGTVELSVENCTGDVCTLPNIELIPIISDNAEIEGPNQVCNNTEVIYTLPKYDGTDYTWSVSNLGTIIDGQGSHRITVLWAGAVPNTSQLVEVVYENCYLECGGSDALAVHILPEFYIAGAPTVCEDTEATFYGKNAETNGQASLNWTLFAPDGSVSYTSVGASTSETIPFNNGPGTYRLLASAGIVTDWCTENAERLIVVNEKPSPASSINGETNICQGATYAYSAATTLVNANFIWEINDGGTITSTEGNPINVTWNSTGPYEISLAQTNIDGLNCQSDFIALSINAIGLVSVVGDDDVCDEEITNYTATNYVGVDYQWTISPTNAGTITHGQGSNEVSVFWTNNGNATLNLNICEQNIPTNVLVHTKPSPSVNAPEWLCAGETATVSTTNSYDSYTWKNEFGTIVSTLATAELSSGFYELIVTNEFACSENISFEIKRYPPPSVSISTPDNSNVCITDNDPYPTLYAEDTQTGYDYQWYQDNNPIGTNSPIFTTTSSGLYHVVVTDINGCQASSNSALVQENCSPDSGGGQCNAGSGNLSFCDDEIEYVFFDIITTNECNTLQFQSTTPNEVDIIAWYFDDGSLSTDDSPTHTFDNAGFYKVSLVSQINLAGSLVHCAGTGIATVPIAAKFDTQSACAGESVVFTDLSTFIPGESIVAYNWDFGDPTSGTNNTSTNPEDTHIYDTPGNYTVSLTVTSATGCTSVKTQEVLVYPNPTVSFAPPVVNCASTSLEFIANVPSNVTEVEWDFGDPTSGTANVAQALIAYHEFENPGTYTVQLTGTSIYGCSFSYQLDIVVEPNNLAGTITALPSTNLCEGDAATLSAPAGGVSWLWSTGETTETITVSTADVYEVTITDAFGCTYTPEAMPVNILPLPQGDIYAVTYDNFGNPINYNFETHEICEGEDVFLQIEETSNFSYSWSTGSTSSEYEFSENRGNQLSAGTYDIAVTITNEDTGCTNISTYQVIVHDVPQNIVIISNSGFPICSGSGATLSVQNPNPNYTYIWNNDATSTSIEVITGGEYWVVAVNQFGCEAESNHITVENAPDIDKIPDGCHTRCAPDTICLPNMPNISAYQWYFNGTAISAPNGTQAELIAEESGEYYLVMEDIFGCTATSDPLYLDLYQGFGTFTGQVYLDTNENGIIDTDDQLLPNIDINIFDVNGVIQSTTSTNNTGEYSFPNILADTYLLELDTMSLPEDIGYSVFQINSELVGCDDTETVNWLCIPLCPTTEESLTFISCDGAPVNYQGTDINAGTQQEFTLVNAAGCDSLVTVSVINAFTPPINESLTVCGTETIEIGGITLAAGDSEQITFTNQYGCDSIVTYNVTNASSPMSSESFTICEGETLNFNGTEITAGSTEIITLSNQAGCDSLIEVSVNAFSATNFNAIATESCWNTADGTITINTPTGGLAPYLYSIDGSNFSDQTAYTNLIGGDYTVYVQDANGCEFTTALQVPTTQELEIYALDQILACDRDQVSLEATISGGRGNIDVRWNTGELTSTIIATQAGSYTCIATDECGSTEIQLEVANEIDTRLSLVYVPNAFSPNNDGMNDKIQGFVANNVEILSYNLMIFDRWGNLMSELTDINEGWNGEYQGKAMTTGVFTYLVKAKVISCGVEKDISMRGDVTLVR